MKKITPKDRLETIFSEATIEEAEQLLDYAGLMVRLKRKWAGAPEPEKRKYTRKQKPEEVKP
jgi:hypothetical protein